MGSKREIGFLNGHRELNAQAEFANFDLATERAMRANMEHWTAGNDKPKTRFHNFPNEPTHKHVFVFKHQEHRLYGFLCHPKPKTAGSFRLCVLCIYGTKFEWASDEAQKDRAEAWLAAPRAIAAIRQLYPEFEGEGGVKWKM